jgi:stage V sporulation protein S
MTQRNEDDVLLKVSASKEPGYTRLIAGAMKWQLREHGLFKAKAIKAVAVNTAVKAIASCNQNVAPADIVLYVDFFSVPIDGGQGRAISMIVQENSLPCPPSFISYRVSGKNFSQDDIDGLASAIVGPIVEAKGVEMRCIGATSVYKTVLSLVAAKGRLFSQGFEMVTVPQWETFVGEDKKEISVIKMSSWGRRTI